MSPAHAGLRAANREPPAAGAAGGGGKRPRDGEDLSERVVRYASAPGPAAFPQRWQLTRRTRTCAPPIGSPPPPERPGAAENGPAPAKTCQSGQPAMRVAPAPAAFQQSWR